MPTKRVTSAASQQHPRSGTVLQEIFARKRETEQLRTEKYSAVAQYYDKWGRITSRFENWTTPEYYEKSDQLLRKDEEARRKAEQLEQRREKLRELLAAEKEAFEKELKQKERAKVRPTSGNADKHDVEVLQRLNSALSEQERRRKEIESKLYSRWRFGMTRDDLILESKNHHQAMAKLNWLDQQVEEQLDRDRSTKEMQVLEMQRQSEALRAEEVALQTKQSREREIAQLKKMLEFHVLELKTREIDSKALKEQNRSLEDVKLRLEMKLQEVQTIFGHRQVISVIPMHNMRRLKVLVQAHCTEINQDVVRDASQLMEIKELSGDLLLASKEQQHVQLLACKFDQELVELQTVLAQFMTMYDSEVKLALLKQQKIWKENAETRFRLLKSLLQELIEKCDTIVGCNTDEMASLIAIKESHLKSINELNDKLRGELPGGEFIAREKSLSAVLSEPPATTSVIKSTQQHSFVSLGEQLEGLRLAQDAFAPPPPDKVNGTPRFGRKKMAWC